MEDKSKHHRALIMLTGGGKAMPGTRLGCLPVARHVSTWTFDAVNGAVCRTRGLAKRYLGRYHAVILQLKSNAEALECPCLIALELESRRVSDVIAESEPLHRNILSRKQRTIG